MSSVNKVIIIGNLGDDPILKETPNGKAVCQMSVATSKKVNEETKTEWHRMTAWGKVAELCGKYLNKGEKAFFEGELETQKWTDKETGKDRYSTQIVVRNVTFLTSLKEKQANGTTATMPETMSKMTNEVFSESEQIPF